MIDDKKAREIIVNSLDTNYFVEASAGSGKTTSLVHRMVALIEKGTPINEICTITFTKAAADEFFLRFQRLLSVRSILLEDDSDRYLGKKTTDSVRNCQKALENIDLCFLGTIDAFLSMVAHELPNEIGLPSDSEVISDDERTNYIAAFYEAILSDERHPLHKYALALKNIFYNPYAAFSAAVDNISDKRNTKIIYDKQLLNVDFDERLKDDKPVLIKVAHIINDLILPYSKGRENELTTIKYKLNDVENESWNNCLPAVTDLVDAVKKIVGKLPKKAIEGTPIEDLIVVDDKDKFTFVDDINDSLTSISNLIDTFKHSLLLHFANEVLGEVNAYLKDEGKFTFYDFLYYCLEAFKKSASTDRVLVDHILERHTHFLLDESQDTNPMQTELFFYITGTKRSNDWTKVEPKEGTLFIVGDPKQSIYGFRSANVQAYLKTKAVFEKKGEVLILTNNFRSLSVLKTWFNDSMDKILHHGEDALSHNDIPSNDNEAVDEENAELDVHLTGLKGAYKYYIDPEQDPDYIASLIYELVNNDKYRLLVKNPLKNPQKPYIYRKIEYKDFLIVPRNTNVDEYIEAFNKFNIPLLIEAKIPFTNAPSLNGLILFALLLKAPHDRGQLLEVLYNFYKLNDHDIAELVNADFSFDIANVDGLENISEKTITIINELHRLYLSTKELSFSSTLLSVLNDIELSLLEKLGSSNLEYTMFLIDKVKEGEENGVITNFEQFKSFLTLYIQNKSDDNRVLRFKDQINRVKLSNLHKVKGLQAPIVILIKPKENIHDAQTFVDYSVNPIETHIRSISERLDNGRTVTYAESHSYDDKTIARWNAFEEAESDRLQYVAATRAESLLLVGENADPVSNGSPWRKLADHIDEEHIFSFEPEIQFVEDEPIDVSYIDSKIDLNCHQKSQKYHSPSNARIRLVNNNADEMNEKREDATTVGTLIHKLMECLISSQNSFENQEELIKNILSSYAEYDYKEMLSNVYKTITKGGYPQKNSVLPNDILSLVNSSKEVYCELPFSYRKYGVVVSGIIDLLYKDENGYHIIDYKTNQEDDVSILEKEYQKQLSDYQEALREIGIEADAHIYHIDVN